MKRSAPASLTSGIGNGSVQRKVGFELEDKAWRAYIKGDGKAEKKDEKKTKEKTKKDSGIRPAVRQELLYAGTGFDLEADDSLGPKFPSLEFVTKPFETSDKGIGELNTAFSDIRKITKHIGQFAPITNPFEGDNIEPKEKHFLTDKKHHLNPTLLLAGGEADTGFKMQATQGVSLEDLPTAMKTFGSGAPKESATEGQERGPARRFMYGKQERGLAGNRIASDLLAAAPSLAQDVIDLLKAFLMPPEREKNKEERKATNPTHPLADTSRLLGFLSAVMLYVKLLATISNAGKQAKYLIPFLARTSFTTLFRLLPEEQQILLREHPNELLGAIIKVANSRHFNFTNVFNSETGKTDEVIVDTNYAPDVSLVRNPSFGLIDLSLSQWITGILKGVELLNPAEIERFLGKDHPKAKTAASSLESFSVLGRESIEPSKVTDDPDIEGHSRLAIFENRLILGPTGFFTASQAHAAALNYLTFYTNLKKGMGAPGMYPTMDVPAMTDSDLKNKKEKKSKKDKKDKSEKK